MSDSKLIPVTRCELDFIVLDLDKTKVTVMHVDSKLQATCNIYNSPHKNKIAAIDAIKEALASQKQALSSIRSGDGVVIAQGKAILHLLHLGHAINPATGMMSTTIGTKTQKGVALSVKRIFEEADFAKELSEGYDEFNEGKE